MSRDSQQPTGRRRGSRPFDLEADAAADLTQEFWGPSRGWDDHTPAHGTEPQEGPPGDELWAERTGSIRAVRAAFDTRRSDQVRRQRRSGGIDRTRSHGIVRPGAPRPVDASDDRDDRDVRDAFADRDRTGQVRRTGTARHDVTRHDATLGQLAAGHAAPDLEWDDDWDLLPATTRQHAVVAAGRTRSHHPVDTRVSERQVELELDDDAIDGRMSDRAGHRRRNGVAPLAQRLGLGAVDPLLLRLGALLLTGALAVPAALSMRDSDAGSLASADGVAAAMAVPAAGAAPATQPAAAPAADSAPVTAATAAAPAAAPVADTSPVAAPADTTPTATTEPVTTEATTTTVPDAVATAATVTEEADRVEPVCALEYEAAAGDSWYRIADSAGISVDELLAANLADLDAPIFPGDEICLPEGASMPTPPTSTTAAPTSTAAPSTTAAPTTTTPADPATRDEVQAMIREIWPDELEEKALQIAKRESNYYADAYNGFCCYGVFQIYYTAHDSWLDDYGINRAEDLFDARKNITAAYALYQRAGGWGPWGG